MLWSPFEDATNLRFAYLREKTLLLISDKQRLWEKCMQANKEVGNENGRTMGRKRGGKGEDECQMEGGNRGMTEHVSCYHGACILLSRSMYLAYVG